MLNKDDLQRALNVLSEALIAYKKLFVIAQHPYRILLVNKVITQHPLWVLSNYAEDAFLEKIIKKDFYKW